MKKWIGIGLLTLLSGFIAYFLLKKDIRSPEFAGVSDIKLISISPELAEIQLELQLYNPNQVKAKLINSELKAELEGLRIGSLSQTKVIEIPEKDSFSIPIAIQIDPKKIILSQGLSGLINQALSSQKSIKPLFSGYVRVQIKENIYTIPLEFEQTLTIQ